MRLPVMSPIVTKQGIFKEKQIVKVQITKY